MGKGLEHFIVSILKSLLRFAGCIVGIATMINNVCIDGVACSIAYICFFFGVAEAFGIIEEIVDKRK